MAEEAKRHCRALPHDADSDCEPTAKRLRAESKDENSSGSSSAHSVSHPFRTNFNDHFETSIAALRDIMVVVDQLRQLLRPSAPENFIVYDPYYCAGAVVHHWHHLGVSRVIHENRDFYDDIANGKTPRDYDMLVTNPPFSEEHIQRLFDYLVQAQRPFAFLVPDYTATKDWYRAAVRRHFAAAPPTGRGDIAATAPRQRPGHSVPPPPPPPFLRSPNGAAGTPAGQAPVMGPEPFYLVPRGRYDFRHPQGAGNEHSHFRSMWFVWAGRRTAEVMRGAKVEFARRGRSEGAAAIPDVVHGLDALAEGNFLQFGARANPQRRAKQRLTNAKQR